MSFKARRQHISKVRVPTRKILRVSRRGVSVQLMYYSHFCKEVAQYEGLRVGSKTCKLEMLTDKKCCPLARETCAKQLRVKDLVFNILQDFSNRATEALRKLVLF